VVQGDKKGGGAAATFFIPVPKAAPSLRADAGGEAISSPHA